MFKTKKKKEKKKGFYNLVMKVKLERTDYYQCLQQSDVSFHSYTLMVEAFIYFQAFGSERCSSSYILVPCGIITFSK